MYVMKNTGAGERNRTFNLRIANAIWAILESPTASTIWPNSPCLQHFRPEFLIPT